MAPRRWKAWLAGAAGGLVVIGIAIFAMVPVSAAGGIGSTRPMPTQAPGTTTQTPTAAPMPTGTMPTATMPPTTTAPPPEPPPKCAVTFTLRVWPSLRSKLPNTIVIGRTHKGLICLRLT
jgi:hypothetical protein